MNSALVLALVGFVTVALSAGAYAYGLIFSRTGFRWIHTVALAAASVGLAQLSAVLMEASAEVAASLLGAQALLTLSVAAQALTILRSRRRRDRDPALSSQERPR